MLDEPFGERLAPRLLHRRLPANDAVEARHGSDGTTAPLDCQPRRFAQGGVVADLGDRILARENSDIDLAKEQIHLVKVNLMKIEIVRMIVALQTLKLPAMQDAEHLSGQREHVVLAFELRVLLRDRQAAMKSDEMPG